MRHTYVKSCANCGKYFESTREHAKYCCISCSNKVRNGRRKKSKQCPHNPYLTCANHKCDSCGWNPEVTQRRMDKSIGKEDKA